MYPVHLLPALLLVVACATPPEVPAPAAPAAVDPHAAGGACEGCHAAEQRAWAGSHHAEAQREGVDARRFDGVTRRVGGLQVTPGLVDGAPAFTVEDAAGRVTLRATGTIGVAPLQQVLLDGARGRSLIAPLAYDLARAAWFDPARLHMSSTVAVGSGWGTTSALQSTSFMYQFRATVTMAVTLGN